MSATDAATVAAVLADSQREHFVMWRALPVPIGTAYTWTSSGPIGEWFCQCGLKFGFSDTAIEHVAAELAAALLAAPPIAQALAAVEAVARVEALDRGHVDDGCIFPDDACRCSIPLFDLRAALRPSDAE